MFAVNYVGIRTMELEEREPADLREGEVRIAVAYVGLCGTDLHVFHGDMDAPPNSLPMAPYRRIDSSPASCRWPRSRRRSASSKRGGS